MSDAHSGSPPATPAPTGPGERSFPRGRMAVGYVALFAILAAVVFVVIPIGLRDQHAGVAGGYAFEEPNDCLGGGMEIRQAGRSATVIEPEVESELAVDEAHLSGRVTCLDGSTALIEADVHDERPGDDQDADDDHRTLSGTIGDVAFTATASRHAEVTSGPPIRRSAEEVFARLMLAIGSVILAARFFGWAVARLGQPRVMGEVLAGILLGPTLLGQVAPGVKDFLFPADIVPLLTAGASIGLVFYMFLVGLELDPSMLRGRVSQAAFISNASVVAPMAMGIAVALPIYSFLAPAAFVPFAIFMGVAMSITAFPVLARILVERRMLKRPVGAMALASAAVDDVTAWALLALATAFATTGQLNDAIRIVIGAAIFSAAMFLVGRRVLSRLSVVYDEAGHVPIGWIAGIFVGILLAAFAAGSIGIAPIFGAFLMGFVMPRRADLTHDVTRRMEDFVVIVLLPLFFVVTGLRTNVGLLDRPELWLLTLGLIGVAVAGKWLAAMAAARFSGFGLQESAVIGALMNTRGLTELIVLNIGREYGVISDTLFTMLVLMALVTTFMAGPALRLIDPRRIFSATAEDELREAEAITPTPAIARPERAILVGPQDEKNLEPLLVLAEALAKQPPRELILARLLVPARAATGLAADDRELAAASRELDRRREALIGRGVPTRALAFTSPDVGEDLVRLSSQEEVDILLLDGSRPLLGEGIPGGAVGVVLQRAPCDVAVLIERHGSVLEIGPRRPVLVPFGGAEHDWTALEMAAWLAATRDAPLKLLGAAADVAEGRRDASRLLGSASLVVQQLAGVSAEPVLLTPGRDAVVEASQGAGLLVIGLSERWRQEGLGAVRSLIARNAPTSTLFVRRGQRPGALAPPDSGTRFAWSMVTPGRAEPPVASAGERP